MATHSSVPAWRIPGMAEPGGLPSMGSHRVRHNLAAAADLEDPYVSKKDLGVYLYKMNSWQLHLHKEEVRWDMCFA